MNHEITELMEQQGFDVEGTMKRFLNNDELYIQCLKEFLADTSFAKLHEAVEEGDSEAAFAAAHTMKGFISNLGINRLYAVLIQLVEKLRNKDMQITEELDRLDTIYRETCQLIEKI